MRFKRSNKLTGGLQRSDALGGRFTRSNPLQGSFVRTFPSVLLGGLFLTALASASSFGSPTIAKAAAQSCSLDGLASTSTIGAPIVAGATPGEVAADSLESTSVIGLPTVALDTETTLAPDSLVNTNSFGSPTVAKATPQALGCDSLTSTAVLGEPILAGATPGQVNPDSLVSSSVIGNPTLAQVDQDLNPSSLASGSALGSSFTVAKPTPQALSLTGLASSSSFGSVTIAAAGGPTEIAAADDAKVHKDSGTTNYDGSVLSVMDYFAALRETFLTFEGCPASSTATLKLVYTGSGGTFINDLDVFASSGSQFDETTLTWNNKPTVTTSVGSVTIDTSSLSWGDEIEIPLTGLSFDGSGNITLRVVASYTSGTLTYTNFGNAEHANSSLHPKLIFS